MDIKTRLEEALSKHFATVAVKSPCPPTLERAMRYAVWPGGARLRPLFTLQVAVTCGDAWPELADASAVAIELMHCASLVHDDLPCFDDADTRRGRPSVHRAFGEPVAVLTGDGLIVAAFEILASAGVTAPHKLPDLVAALAGGVGPTRGIIAGQAWESEVSVDLAAYHRAKTGALFEAAGTLGALCGGGDPRAWAEVGRRIGEAYQIADDLADALGEAQQLGKPAGQDVDLNRPSAVRAYGVHAAAALLTERIRQAELALPAAPNREHFRQWLDAIARRLLPADLSARQPEWAA